MTYDMGGGLAWPVKGQGAAGPPIGSVRLERQVAYTGNPVGVAATGTNGQPYNGPLEVVLRERSGAELRRTTEGGAFSTVGVPAGRYRVTVGGVNAGPLAVL